VTVKRIGRVTIIFGVTSIADSPNHDKGINRDFFFFTIRVNPQERQVSTLSDNSLLHSGQLINAIVYCFNCKLTFLLDTIFKIVILSFDSNASVAFYTVVSTDTLR